MIEDPEAATSFADHEAGLCMGTFGACTWHDAEDLLRAAQIKRATRALDVRKLGYSSVATEAYE